MTVKWKKEDIVRCSRERKYSYELTPELEQGKQPAESVFRKLVERLKGKQPPEAIQ